MYFQILNSHTVIGTEFFFCLWTSLTLHILYLSLVCVAFNEEGPPNRGQPLGWGCREDEGKEAERGGEGVEGSAAVHWSPPHTHTPHHTNPILLCSNAKIRIRTRQQHLANWIKIRTQICTDLKKLKTLKMFNKPLQTVTNKQITLLNYWCRLRIKQNNSEPDPRHWYSSICICNVCYCTM